MNCTVSEFGVLLFTSCNEIFFVCVHVDEKSAAYANVCCNILEKVMWFVHGHAFTSGLYSTEMIDHLIQYSALF